jgi:hypothetical protein
MASNYETFWQNKRFAVVGHSSLHTQMDHEDDRQVLVITSSPPTRPPDSYLGWLCFPFSVFSVFSVFSGYVCFLCN